MVTPAFRPGECGPRPPVWKTAPSYGSMSSPPASHGRDIDTIPKRHLSGEYRPPDGLAWCIRLPPRPKGRGYRKVRLSGELCLSGECLSPDTRYLGGSAKRLLFFKKFCNSPFFLCVVVNGTSGTSGISGTDEKIILLSEVPDIPDVSVVSFCQILYGNGWNGDSSRFGDGARAHCNGFVSYRVLSYESVKTCVPASRWSGRLGPSPP